MKQRETAIRRRTLGIVMRGLVLPVAFLAAINTANAGAGGGGGERGGPAAPPPEPAEPPQTPAPAAPANPIPDGFKMGGFTFKPGGRIKLDVIRDFNPI